MMNYDPNLFLCGNRARQEIKLTFAMWSYRQERTVIFYSNVSGLDSIKAAVEQVYSSLPGDERHDIPQIVLKNESGDELVCEDDEEDGEDWLFKMLIKAEVVSVQPGGKIFDDIPEDATR